MLTIVIALIALNPISPTFNVEPDDTGIRPMYAEFFPANVGVDDVIVRDWRFESDSALEFATYSASTDTLTIAPGYDCTDIVRVVAGLPATKEPVADTFVDGGGSGSTGCWIDASGELSCGATVSGDAGLVYEGYWDDAPYVFSPEADVGVFWSPPLWYLGWYSVPLFSLGVFGTMSLGQSVWFVAMMMLVANLWRRLRMSEAPIPPAAPAEPDGLIDWVMRGLFGRSWRTGVSGFAGVALTVVAAVSSIEGPYTWQKLAPLAPGLVASLGLMVAKDGKVSHTQTK